MQTKTGCTKPLLDIDGLKTGFRVGGRDISAVDDVSLVIHPGETVALVGESGCGKSVTALSITRLIPEPPGHIRAGRIQLNDQDLLSLSRRELRDVRGRKIAYVFQDPGQSLNPVFRIGMQIEEALRFRRDPDLPDPETLLNWVGMPDPGRVLRSYPHELSGGMKQRVMLAMALACRPDLLIADEPTTALDVTVQAQILRLLADLQARLGMAVLLITHNLGIVSEIADRVYVMYAGRIVESGPAGDLLRTPAHPYTLGLLQAVPRLRRDGAPPRHLEGIPGVVPSPSEWPEGCRFAERCSIADQKCHQSEPSLRGVGQNHEARCWKPMQGAGVPDLPGEQGE